MNPPVDLPPLILTNGSNIFAYNTMRLRHPKMLREVIDTNPLFPNLIKDELEMLQNDLITDAPILMLNLFPTQPPDYIEWASSHIEHRTHSNPNGQPSWLNTEWFFAETVLFRIIIETTRWWETRHDPFAAIKARELQSNAMWDLLESALTLDGGVMERIPHLVRFATWGNRMDLSYDAAAALGTIASDDDLLVNDSDLVANHLLKKQLEPFPRENQGISHIICDNAGTELAMDLALTDALLTGFSDIVVLHVKYHPTFVSDATSEDVLNLIQQCINGQHGTHSHQSIIDMGNRLNDAFLAGRLRLAPNLFWNSSRYLWDMPNGLARVFEGAQLVVIKGDANYRRTIGDALWDATTPFEELVSYFPAPILMLRTLKSDPVVGLVPGMADMLDRVDESWRVNGKRGVIQLRI